MSWLEDRKIVYNYKCDCGHTTKARIAAAEDAPPSAVCSDCGKEAFYSGFDADIVKQTNIVSYDKNGILALRVRRPDGTLQHISKEKLHYMKTGRIEHQYTKAYREHLAKAKQDDLLKADQAKGKGKASIASKKEIEQKLKNMPDGEYLSNGTDIIKTK